MKPKVLLKLKILSVTFLALICVLSFQNCGSQNIQFEDLQETEDSRFLSYPYTSTPVFLYDVQLFSLSGGTKNLKSFRIIAAFSTTRKPASDIAYEIRVQDQDGQTRCPTESGFLPPGLSSVEYDCVSSSAMQGVQVRVEMTSGADHQIIEKQFP